MIHYSCDRCHQMINGESEIRYSVQIEIRAHDDSHEFSLEPTTNVQDEALTELQSLLDSLNPAEREELAAQAFQIRKYDLCANCYRQYIRNPLSVDMAKLEFSDN